MNSVISVLSKTPNILRELRKALPNYTFHEIQQADTDENLKRSEIIVADFDLLGPYIYSLPNAKYVQGTWAGVDKLTPRLHKSPPFKIVRFSGHYFGQIMGEYVLASIVNFERNMFECRELQKEKKWGHPDANHKINNNYRTVYDLTIGIMGLGNIGSRIGKILQFMGAIVVGYGRRLKSELKGDFSFLTGYYSDKMLPEFLTKCHYVVNVLPNTSETSGLLKGNILQNCSEIGTVFINIGRGSIIPETDLIRALEKKWIAGAILDVFESEPLSPDSPLWNFPQVFITPHNSGATRAKDVAQQFKNNLQLYENNQEIPATFDFAKGY